MKVTNSKGLF